MMSLKRTPEGCWEIFSDNSQEENRRISDILQAAAHEGVGCKKPNGKKFSIRFNGTEVFFESNRELWTFARGLEFAHKKAPKKTIPDVAQSLEQLEEEELRRMRKGVN